MKVLALALLSAIIVALPTPATAEWAPVDGVTVTLSSGEESIDYGAVGSPGSPIFRMETMSVVPKGGALATEAVVGRRFEQPFVTSLENYAECVWNIEGLPAETWLALEVDPADSTPSAVLLGTPRRDDEGRFEVTITAQDVNDVSKKASFTFELDIRPIETARNSSPL